MIKNVINRFQNSDQNSKNVIANVLGAFLVKGGALIVTLLATPAYIRFFNDNKALGVWYTLLSIITWILNFDLGIGNGLRNKLTESLAKDDKELSRKYISSAYISIGGIVVVTAIVFLIIFNRIDWNHIFNIDTGTISKDALSVSVVIIILGILVQFLLKLITSILYALQLSSVNNALSLITSTICLLYVLLASPGTNDQNIITMAIVHAVAVLVPLLITTFVVFTTKLKGLLPSYAYFNRKCAKEILGLGGTFFIVQIAYMMLVNTNEYFISYLTDASYVVDYQIYFKLFTLIGTLTTLALTPIWSAITKAFSEKNYKWIKSLYRKMMLLGWGSCIFEFVFIAFIQLAVNIWLGDKSISVNYFYAASFAILGSCMIMNGVLSSFANGIGKLKPQIICFGIGAIIKIPLSKLLITMTSSWIGIILSVDISMVVFVIVQYIVNKKTIASFTA